MMIETWNNEESNEYKSRGLSEKNYITETIFQ